METIERLKIFCLVADKQSFAQAADQLGLARSNVTYNIQALEKEYEVLLFYRTTRKVTLTHEGELFYDEAIRLISQLKELHRFKSQIRNQQGKISIGLPKRIATQILIPNLHEFYKNYPDIKILINGSDDFCNLLEDQLDCVVRVGAVPNHYLIRRHILEVAFVTLVSPSYIEKLGLPTDLNTLESHYAVDYHVAKNYADFSTIDFQDQIIKIPYRLLVENTETYIHAGLAGHGIIQIPYFDAKTYIDSGALIPIFTDIPSLKRPVNILLSDRKYRPKYLQDFIEWLRQLLLKYML